ncbi:MAG: choline-sulfatase [Pseudomonadota bacterium]
MTDRPNILILMVDQLNGRFFPDGPEAWLHTPNLARLAERSVRFANAYCASPLCAPSRASFMTGMLPSRTHVYDNAAEFASDLPTFAHHLRRAGYRTVLSGKMHFVGPDQLHGFEERLTTDVYPADFGWTPDWRRPGERIDWWYHNLGSVTGAGPAVSSNQLDFDDETTFEAVGALRNLARSEDARPWCLTLSLTHPHDPYVNRPEYWQLYDDCQALDPQRDDLPGDPHSARLVAANDAPRFAITPQDVRRARQGYFASISYVDARIGEVLAALETMGEETVRNTAILFLSDHGDMLGERGLWFKMSFREGSARVPMMLAAPGLASGRVDTPVSTLDAVPTLADLAGLNIETIAHWLDGVSLLPVAEGGTRAPVPMEYMAEGSIAPMVSLVDWPWKIVLCPADPDQLFRLDTDPEEARDLARDPDHAELAERLVDAVAQRWDLQRIDRDVRESQARRLAVYPALRAGAHYPWDWQPLKRASERFMRNHLDLNRLEDDRRFPKNG